MKKWLLILGTVVVVGLGFFGYWIYDMVQNGLRTYEIGGATVSLSGFEAAASTGEPTIGTATFAQRHMPYPITDFPLEEACNVIAADPPSLPVIGVVSADILTVIATDFADDERVAQFAVTDQGCEVIQ